MAGRAHTAAEIIAQIKLRTIEHAAELKGLRAMLKNAKVANISNMGNGNGKRVTRKRRPNTPPTAPLPPRERVLTSAGKRVKAEANLRAAAAANRALVNELGYAVAEVRRPRGRSRSMSRNFGKPGGPGLRDPNLMLPPHPNNYPPPIIGEPPLLKLSKRGRP